MRSAPPGLSRFVATRVLPMSAVCAIVVLGVIGLTRWPPSKPARPAENASADRPAPPRHSARVMREVDSKAVQDLRDDGELEILELAGNDLVNGDLAPLGTIRSLENVTIHGPRLTLEGVRALAPLKKLRVLELDLRGPGASRYSAGSFALGALREQPISELRIKAPCIALGYLNPVAEFSSLTSLHIEADEIDESESLNPLPRLAKVRFLKVHARTTNGRALLASISRMPSLEHLDLHVAFDMQTIAVLRHAPNLRVLTLRGPMVDDASLTLLRDVPKLEEISLIGTSVSDAVIGRLRAMNLKVGTKE